MLDDYGYGPKGKKHDPNEWSVKINLTKAKALWKNLWRPTASDVDKWLDEGFKRDWEWEQTVGGANNITREELIKRLSDELKNRKENLT